MKKKTQRMYSLKKQISGILITAILVVLVISVVLLFGQVQKYQKEMDAVRNEALMNYAKNLDEKIQQLNDVSKTIYASDTAFEGLNHFKSAGEQFDDVYGLLKNLEIQVRSNQNLEGLFTFYNGGENQIYYLRDTVPYKDQETLKQTGKIAVSEMQNNSIRREYEGAVIKAEKGVYYNVFLKKTLATLMGTIRLDQGLSKNLEENASYGVIYNGQYYRTAGADLEPERISSEGLTEAKRVMEHQVLYSCQVASTNLYVVEVVPKTIWIYINRLHILLGTMILVLMIVLVQLYRIISVQVTRPLEDMTRALSEIQAGVWEVEFREENHLTEIEDVRNTVRLLLSEIEQYKIRTYEEKLENQKTKLQFLQLQLAPHFYTNCMKNAYYMLALKEYGNAEKFLLCLSSHLRYLLNNKQELVEVETEKEFLENYMELQRLMTDKPLLCEMEIPEEVYKIPIPILALQTFVENSVKYTKGSNGQNLKITVRIHIQETEEGRYLDIFVKDNGDGYPEEVLEMLNSGTGEGKEKLGVGILNLLNRVKLQYGTKAKWYFENAGGAASELLLPLP